MALAAGLPFTGRTAQLRTLQAALRDAHDGRPRVVVLSGPAGAGKSALLREFVAPIPDGVLVARGGCRPGGRLLPFEPFTEALRPALRGRRDDPLLSALFASTRSRSEADTADPAEPSRYALFEAVLEFLGDREQPVVLIVDDLHWADRSSLDLLTFLARNMRHEQVLFVIALREPGPPDVESALDELRRTCAPITFRLPPLSSDELTQLVEAVRGARPDPAEVARIETLTGGMPFYVERVLDDPGTGSPAAVATLVSAELDAVPVVAQDLLEAVAVAGGSMPSAMLEAAFGAAAADALSALMRARMLRAESGTIRLRHDLYREAILARLTATRTRELHALVARVGDLGVGGEPALLPAAEVAAHWQQAGEPRRALPALRRAALSAEEALAFREAQLQWSAIVRLAPEHPTDDDRASVLEALIHAADAARWTGEVEIATESVSRALRMTAPHERALRALLHRRRAGLRYLAGDMADARWEAARGATLLRDDDPDALRADVLAEQARMLVLTGDYMQAQGIATTALTLARRSQEPALESRILSTLGVAQLSNGDAEAALRSLADARSLAAGYGDFEDKVRANTNMAFVQLSVGHLREGRAAALETLELTRRAGLPEQDGAAAVSEDNVVHADISLGLWDEAEQLLTRHLARGHGSLVDRAWRLGTRAQLRAAIGRFDEAAADLDELAAHAVAEPAVRAGAAAAASELAIWTRQPRRAFDAACAALDESAPAGERAYVLVWAVRATADLADLARLRNDTVEAVDLVGRLDSIVARFGHAIDATTVAPLAAAQLTAELARARAEDDALTWTTVVQAAAEFPYEQAYGRLRRAEVLLRRGDRTAAAADLTLARTAAEAIGARPLIDAIDVLVTRERVELPVVRSEQSTPAQAPALQLTAREQQVLVQLRLGMTNRRIGRVLGISEKTASVHVSNILGKLGVANRTAAAAVASRLGL